MKIAIPTADGRVSPLFDVSRHLLLLDTEAGVETQRQDIELQNGDIMRRAKQIVDLKVRVVICGAISKPFDSLLTTAGVQIIPNTCGPTEEVLRVFLMGRLTEEAYLLPGAHGHRRRSRIPNERIPK